MWTLKFDTFDTIDAFDTFDTIDTFDTFYSKLVPLPASRQSPRHLRKPNNWKQLEVRGMKQFTPTPPLKLDSVRCRQLMSNASGLTFSGSLTFGQSFKWIKSLATELFIFKILSPPLRERLRLSPCRNFEPKCKISRPGGVWGCLKYLEIFWPGCNFFDQCAIQRLRVRETKVRVKKIHCGVTKKSWIC